MVTDGRPSKPRVLIVDQSERIRRDIQSFLEESGRYEVVGCALTFDEPSQIARATHPEIVLVDVEMEDQDGISVLRNLRACLPSTSLVVATHFDRDEYDAAARDAGAAASIAKRRLFESLIPTLEKARESARRSHSDGRIGETPPDIGPFDEDGPGNRCLSKVGAIWWRPRDWREWAAGAGGFGMALVRGAPMDSSPPTSYWRYVEAAMGLLLLLLLVGFLGGGFDEASEVSKALISTTLLALAWAEFRQVKRLSATKRPSQLASYSHNTRRRPRAQVGDNRTERR